MAEPYELSLSESAVLIAMGELSPVDLVESLLQRIDALEPALNAWVRLDRDAILAEYGTGLRLTPWIRVRHRKAYV